MNRSNAKNSAKLDFKRPLKSFLATVASVVLASPSVFASSWTSHTDCTDPNSGLTMHESKSGMARDRSRDHKTVTWTLMPKRPNVLPTPATPVTTAEIEAIVAGVDESEPLTTFDVNDLVVDWQDDKAEASDYSRPTYSTYRRTPYTQTVTLRRHDNAPLLPESQATSMTALMYCMDVYRYNR